MKGYQPGNTFLSIIANLAALTIAVLGISGFALANEVVAPSGARIEFSRSPQALIVSYAVYIGEIAEPDRGPTLQIYGDGLAQVYYPAYMTRAGHYSLQLSDDEMAALLDSLVADGVLKFDSSKARAAVREIETLRRENQGMIQYVSDSSTSVIEVNLVRYTSPGEPGVQTVNVKKTIRWSGLQSDARQYPNLVAIQNLAIAEQTLRTFIERPDLVRVDSRIRAPSSMRR